MTASLPVPNDIDPEEPDRHSAARVMRLAETVPPAPDKPRRPPRKPRSDKDAPRKKRAPRSAEPQPDPGGSARGELQIARKRRAAGLVGSRR
ncbi:ABC transporter, partial [Microbacterium sp. ZW CA_36]